MYSDQTYHIRQQVRQNQADIQMHNVANDQTSNSKSTTEKFGAWPNRYRSWAPWILGIFSVVILLIIILVGVGYKGVEIYELAFRKTLSSNKIDTTRVYKNGQYYVDVDHDFFTFPRNKIRVDLPRVPIFINSNSDLGGGGFETPIDIIFFYRLNDTVDSLSQLFRTFGPGYQSQIEPRANSRIKNDASNLRFTVSDFLINRPFIRRTFFHGLQQELHLIGMEIKDEDFFLHLVDFPLNVDERNLETVLVQQEAAKALLDQRVDEEVALTDRLRRDILNQVRIIQSTSQAQAQTIIENTFAQGNRTLDEAEARGFATIFDTFEVRNSAKDLETKEALNRVFILQNVVTQTSA